MADLPSGTVTFLFTDVEGSTRLLKELGRTGYGEVMADHARLLRQAFAAHSGEEIDTQGDSFFVAFRSAADAVAAAAEIQRSLAAYAWPAEARPRVRIGIHTGEAAATSERYLGLAVHRAARIAAAGHGGQVLISNTTRELVEDDLSPELALRDLGEHRLKDLDRPEHLFQLDIDGLAQEFPPLRTVEAETAFAGREEELAEEAAAVMARPRWHRRPLVVGALAGVIAAAVAIPVFALGQGGSGRPSLSQIDGNAVGVVDPETNKLVDSVTVGATPSEVATGAGAIWATNADGRSVSRIDPQTRRVVQTVDVGNGPSGIVVGYGAVWVANHIDGTVSRIDPQTNRVVQTIGVGGGPEGVAAGAGSIWVTNRRDDTVSRIDARTGRLLRTFPAGSGASGIAVADGAVWVANESAGTVARIDPRTNTVAGTINVGNGPSALAAGAGAVWVANNLDGTVMRIDEGTETVTSTLLIGRGLSDLAVSRSALWATNDLQGTVTRIDPRRNSVVETIRVGNRPAGIAATAGGVFVAVRSSGRRHRGGTLRLQEAVPTTSVDSAVNVDGLIPFSVGDGLTAYRRVGGSDGSQLVPDLATSLPAPTDAGTTYTFQLHRGIHYSTGALVKPDDFRRALERTFVLKGWGTSYYEGIVGAASCVKRPKGCDLTRGIVADDKSGTVTFHLLRHDPQFLYKLALPFAFPVPAGTPRRDVGTHPLPATGPYMIKAFRPKREIKLVRNPRFRVWSETARPGGYPNQIILRLSIPPEKQMRAVEQGQADGVLSEVPPKALRDLETRFSGQLYVYPRPATDYLVMNTRLPPFDDIRVRRALNYAIDRATIGRLLGSERAFPPTCQVLPPAFPGYQRYCPYTLHPSSSGAWNAPNVSKAKALVAASGTKGMKVTYWTFQRPGPGDLSPYFQALLNNLGYQARIKRLPFSYASPIYNSKTRVQITYANWIADYPTASTFFEPLLTCASFKPGSNINNNLAEFCNRKIDAKIEHALNVQAQNPGAANELWAKIDHEIVNNAPWAPMINESSVDFLSKRVGNYQFNPQYRMLIDQVWVR